MHTSIPAQASQRGESGGSGLIAAPTSKPGERRLTRLIVVCILILVGVFFWVSIGKPTLGPLTMHAALATIPLFALLCIGWVPIVWAALRWMVRDTLRLFLPPARGRHARAPHPGVATAAFVLSASAFAFVYVELGAGYLPTLLDWWEGPAHYEGLTCQNFDEIDGVRPATSSFELVGPDGTARSFTVARADLLTATGRAGSPYATILSACSSSSTTLDASIYPRTGLIAEASVRQ
ncbi:hypothetical protein [uncultured Actinomyces sp.]|uniref:hypothetical protein n=1 Tax=uncultured Actinomyces sp. TaxID=249061 RepID=UPI00261547D0|nr:hypothetical protein [uncultured Actinomyces sp.]